MLLVGVAYKPGVADLRESPALEIMEELHQDGAKVHFADPLVPTVRLGSELLASEVAPEADHWDLVLVHTVHPGADLDWLAGLGNVLDATYRLDSVPARAIL